MPRAPVGYRVENVAAAVRRHAARHGGAVAMVCGARRQTYSELHDRSQRLVHALRGLGVAKEERVALLVDNGPTALEQVVGLSMGGFVRTPLYTHDMPERHLYLLDLVDAVALIVDGSHYPALAPLLPQSQVLRHVVVVDGAEGTEPPGGACEVHDYEGLLANAAADEVEIGDDPRSPHQIRFSAGTTGLPKGILHDLAAWAAVGEGTARVLDEPVTRKDRYLAAGPLTHAASMPVWPVLAAGGAVIVMPAFDPADFLRVVEEERITMTLLVPTMVQMIIDHPDAARRDLSSFRAVFYGASPMPESTLVGAVELWGNVLYQLYGQSEAVPITSLRATDHVLNGAAEERARLRSAGRVVEGAELRIVGDDDTELPAGEVGEVWARTAGRMCELWKDPEATRARITDDGWVRTRDMGWVDAEGFLFLADRKEDMIISGGFNIWPAELENALVAHPAVREAAVVGVPDPRWGETPCAAVVLQDGGVRPTGEELIEWTRAKVGSVKKVTAVHFVDELPKTPIGKVLRRLVRDHYFT